eukprot:2128408-Rhodomonas_salina.1
MTSGDLGAGLRGGQLLLRRPRHLRLLVRLDKVHAGLDPARRVACGRARSDGLEHVLGGVLAGLGRFHGRRAALEVLHEVARGVHVLAGELVGQHRTEPAVVDHQAALLEEQQAVEHAEDLERRLVDGAQHSAARRSNAAHSPHHYASGPRVQSGRRLVEEQHL